MVWSSLEQRLDGTDVMLDIRLHSTSKQRADQPHETTRLELHPEDQARSRLRSSHVAAPTDPHAHRILRVILVSKGGEELVDPPGRDLLVSGAHTFAEIASAIDRAFARWHLSHLHEFRLVDGRQIVMEDADEFEESDSSEHLDERAHSLSSMGLSSGDTFVYIFDLGDDWEHGCTVLRTDVDPEDEAGIVPSEICQFSVGEQSRTSTDVCLCTTIRTSNEMEAFRCPPYPLRAVYLTRVSARCR